MVVLEEDLAVVVLEVSEADKVLIFLISLFAATIFCSSCSRPEKNENLDFTKNNVILIVVDADVKAESLDEDEPV